MNEIVLELAKQAGLKKEHGSREYIGNFDWREFAELIVWECADVCKQFGQSGDGYTCSAEILKYFGVEE